MIEVEKVTEKERDLYNSLVDHPLQSFEWGEFRKETGLVVERRVIFENGKPKNAFCATFHRIPLLPYTIGYVPKINFWDRNLLSQLVEIGRSNKCVFVQIEPNIENKSSFVTRFDSEFNIKPSFHPLFPRYTFVLDLKKSEEQLLSNMHPKTRYNIRVAQKHGVVVFEDNSEEAFEAYLLLLEETTKRQGFFAHSKDYHRKMWKVLQENRIKTKQAKKRLEPHLFLAKYQGEILVAWMLFVFGDTLYYPYGASSSKHRNVMASNLMMWEAIRFGRRLGLSKFDMWGALGPNPSLTDPWFGFHRFKQGFGARLVEFVGSFDLVLEPHLYNLLKIADKSRWFLLKLKQRLV
jgi:lipid II:glycine glycyltransferase (peptidoglycan interpeptide bridge formation enzyme)